jgi:hypothetical protein
LYDLDSDEDELDFLKVSQGVDLQKRDVLRAEKKLKKKRDLF